MRQILSLNMTDNNIIGNSNCKMCNLLNLTNSEKYFMQSSIIWFDCTICNLLVVALQSKLTLYMSLFVIFVEFIKAFDTGNREAL